VIYRKKDAFWGGLLLACSDSFAAYLINQFSWPRFIGMLILGATIYTLETVNVFHWIEKTSTDRYRGIKAKLFKTIAIILFFNPLWIFRHYVFIDIFSGNFNSIELAMLSTASFTYLVNIPFSFIMNYVIQNEIPLKHRFIGASMISAIMAIFFALSKLWFA
jgi:hypothetical protein